MTARLWWRAPVFLRLCDQISLGLGMEVKAEVAGALVKDDLGHGVCAAEVAGGLTRGTSAAGSEISGSVERIAQSRGCATVENYVIALLSGVLEAQAMGCSELLEEDLRQKLQTVSRTPMPR